MRQGQNTEDGKFTYTEVECLGACVNAPMVQINDDYYEDLTPEIMGQMIDKMAKGKAIDIGSQSGRKGSMAQLGSTTLADAAKQAGVTMREPGLVEDGHDDAAADTAAQTAQ